MNRRNFLTNLAAGAAVVLGAGAVKGAVYARTAEASEAVAVGPGCGNCQTSFPSIAALDEHYERWHGIAPRTVTTTPAQHGAPLPAFEDDDRDTPFVGSTCFDTANNRLMVWDGQRWLGSVGFV